MERVPQLVRRGKKDRRMGAPSELDWEAEPVNDNGTLYGIN